MGNSKNIPRYLRPVEISWKEEFETSIQKTLKESGNRSKKTAFRKEINFVFDKKYTLKGYEYPFLRYLADLCRLAENHELVYLKRLVMHLEKNGLYNLLSDEKYLKALLRIAEKSDYTIRELEQWKPKGYNAERQFKHLIKHLFVKYKLSNFWNNAWFSGNEYERRWFLEVTHGASIRDFVTQIKMTKKMAHIFINAPDYMNITEALRYAQTLAFGGTEYLAYFINRSLIGRNNFKDEEFWRTVIQFLAQAEMFDYRQIEHIVDYLHGQYQQNPQYSMKGRTIQALLRQTHVWLLEQNLFNERKGRFLWNTCGIRSFNYVGMWGTYVIKELTSSGELYEEGKNQKHCVSGYSWSAYKKQCAIFSMRVKEGEKYERVITIEVDLDHNRIVQTKGKYNRALTQPETSVLLMWAEQENLKIAKWIL